VFKESVFGKREDQPQGEVWTPVVGDLEKMIQRTAEKQNPHTHTHTHQQETNIPNEKGKDAHKNPSKNYLNKKLMRRDENRKGEKQKRQDSETFIYSIHKKCTRTQERKKTV